MLNWDDYNTEEAAGAPAAAAAAAVAEAAPAPAAAAPAAAPEPVAEPAPAANDNVAAAARNLATLDVAPGLKELEMGAARVSVDEKAMINCRADLNQLVPFKYDWA